MLKFMRLSNETQTNINMCVWHVDVSDIALHQNLIYRVPIEIDKYNLKAINSIAT